MKQNRPPFMPVTPDIDDDALESLAREKGVGSLVKPVANRAGEMRASSTVPRTPTVQTPQITPPAPPPATSDTNRPKREATPRSRMKPVNIELPDYAWTDLKIRAAKEQVSVRHIIMAALREQGIVITDADMIEDGRRLRT
jgi:hypothetical protein